MNAKSYILTLAGCALALALLVAGINFMVDPYGISGAPRVAGLNEYKTEINDRVRLLKKYQALESSLDTLIIGNSRAELGLNPRHQCFDKSGLKAYNMGVPGAGVRRQLQYALNIIYQQPVRRVLISVDFPDFISARPQPAGDTARLRDERSGEFSYLASGRPNPDYRMIALMDYYKALFSLDALTSSVKTVMLQSPGAPDRDAAAFNPARDMAHAVQREGARALFDQKMHSLRNSYSRELLLTYPGESSNSQLEDLAEFLDIAAARNIRVDVFLNPFHQMFWDLLEDSGLMPLYRHWRQMLLALLSQRSGQLELSVWDFSHVAPYTLEPVPEPGVRTGPLDWFWEPAHYRRELGDLMLDTMLGDSCGREAATGTRLL